MPEGNEGQAPTGSTSQADNQGSAGDGQEQVTMATPAELQRARSEAAKYRTELRDAKEKLDALTKSQKEADDAKKSEVQRLTERTTELEGEIQKRDGRLKELTLSGAVMKRANALGIVDPDAAWRLLDSKAVTFDEDGEPKNIDDLLTTLIEEKPYLKGKTTVKDPAPKDGTSPTKPDGSKKRPITYEDVTKMTDDEINANWDEVQKVLASSGR